MGKKRVVGICSEKKIFALRKKVSLFHVVCGYFRFIPRVREKEGIPRGLIFV